MKDTTTTIDEILDFHRRMFGVKDKDFNVQLKQAIQSLITRECVKARINELEHMPESYTLKYDAEAQTKLYFPCAPTIHIQERLAKLDQTLKAIEEES